MTTCHALLHLPKATLGLMLIRCRLLALEQTHLGPDYLQDLHRALHLYLLLEEAIQAAIFHSDQ
jgi:hypothetical protein